jgi:hypothetical protein
MGTPGGPGPGARPDAGRHDGRDQQLLSLRSLTIIAISCSVALFVGVTAGIAAAGAAQQSISTGWRVAIGIIAGVAAGTISWLGAAAKLHQLVDNKK